IGDPHRLEQILSNLLSNAIKFSHYEGPAVEVEADVTHTSSSQGKLSIRVRDHGVGIAKEDLAKLFQDFHQIRPHELQNGGGSGLGLSIVSRLAEAMGGSVGVESEPGKGSCFYFSIPYGMRPGLLPHDEEGMTRGKVVLAKPKPTMDVGDEPGSEMQ
ncbi:unnamed protein product, partial [Chrysoparadoxa australica]